jgi:hypothetical protein
MAELWHPTKRIHIEILGGELDGVVIDSDRSTPLERHFWAMLQQLAIGQTIQGIKLLDALALLQNQRRVVEVGRLTEEYTVVAKEEDESELFMQLRHRFLPQK